MASRVNKGFKVVCPICGEGSSVAMDLNKLGACSCGECSEDFTVADAVKEMAERLRQWKAVARWIELADAAADDAAADDA